MQITVDVPGEYASQLAAAAPGELAEIVALGLREWQSRQAGEFTGLRSLLERLAGLPEPQDVLHLRPTNELTSRANELLEKSHSGTLSETEEGEWHGLELAEHLVRIAKAKAALKLQRP